MHVRQEGTENDHLMDRSHLWPGEVGTALNHTKWGHRWIPKYIF